MSLAYTYVVGESVMQLFVQCKRREREELLRIFERLGSAPCEAGDYVQRTTSLREIQVKRFGKWLISYWPDHAV